MNYQGTYPWLNPEVAHLRRSARARHKQATYGVRTTQCTSCSKHLRDEDVKQGVCQWCAWTGEEQAKESEVR